ncbi:hypothetical protein D3C73_1041710 [compost metagenome]
MRYGEAAFFFQATLLHIAPVMVGAPHHTAGKPWLEGHGARAVVTAEGDTLKANTLGIHVAAGFQPVDHAAGPVLAVVAGNQVVQAQCFTGAGLVDDQRRDAAFCQPGRQADAVFHFLGRIQSVDLHQDRRRAAHTFGTHQQAGNMFALVGDFNALAVLPRQFDTAFESLQKTLVQLGTARRAMGLQAFAGQVIGGGTVVFLTGGQQPAIAFVFLGQAAEFVGHLRPGFTKRLGSSGVGLLGGFLQWRAHLFDFAHAGAHLDRQVDGEIPHVIGREITEHDCCCPCGCLVVHKAR